ncbi:alkaline phosphatase D family protein [Flexivirga meconopsidis]|uniref:alkaline phosphatase D family protein n=1 Tax=Flexivirga meconopsidis TaxID=2977121 RepID=UPI00223F61B3|nr:alkaline phosphatase D family protein [Flexivirga meconopsidis]
MTAELLLGPLVRYVDETSATIWVETSEATDVTVSIGQASWLAPTFSAHGKHYALVIVDGLAPGSVSDYQVRLGGAQVWPPADSPFPPSRVATLDPAKPLRMAFGSCRTSVPHNAEGNRTHGVDAMRAYAYDMANNPDSQRHWPDLVLFLGDQVYADETSPAMQDFIEKRRGLEEPPGEELKDFVEYAHLYHLAWSDPANRWLLSTLPSAMIFDDHDVRDDWNTSLTWHEEMNAVPWWHERIVGALASYWVYQHAGNLSPDELAKDPIWQAISSYEGPGEYDATELLDSFAERVDKDPTSYRFSYARDLDQAKLIVIDSRAARVLEPDRRAMLDDNEWQWLDGQLRGDIEHLLIGTSLPVLLPPGIHDLESLNEAMAEGAWGERVGRFGEKVRQAVDLEHWAAFEKSFRQLIGAVVSVARGERGKAPGTITFLSGDVHNSYVTELDRDVPGMTSVVAQAVCSPIRNPLPVHVRALQGGVARGLARPMRALVSRMRKVPNPPYDWSITHGPWFDNNLATLEVSGDSLLLTWDSGEVVGEEYDNPKLRRVAEVRVGPRED